MEGRRGQEGGREMWDKQEEKGRRRTEKKGIGGEKKGGERKRGLLISFAHGRI